MPLTSLTRLPWFGGGYANLACDEGLPQRHGGLMRGLNFLNVWRGAHPFCLTKAAMRSVVVFRLGRERRF